MDEACIESGILFILLISCPLKLFFFQNKKLDLENPEVRIGHTQIPSKCFDLMDTNGELCDKLTTREIFLFCDMAKMEKEINGDTWDRLRHYAMQGRLVRAIQSEGDHDDEWFSQILKTPFFRILFPNIHCWDSLRVRRLMSEHWIKFKEWAEIHSDGLDSHLDKNWWRFRAWSRHERGAPAACSEEPPSKRRRLNADGEDEDDEKQIELYVLTLFAL